jgi:hypothetical protein
MNSSGSRAKSLRANNENKRYTRVVHFMMLLIKRELVGRHVPSVVIHSHSYAGEGALTMTVAQPIEDVLVGPYFLRGSGPARN